MKKKITAIVLAAGQGKRMNSAVAKQFLMLQDKPVLYYALKSFEESSVDDILLVTGAEQVEYCQKHIIDHYQFRKVSKIIEGGVERYDSVSKALEAVDTTDYVLIHDGARPFITKDLIEMLIEQVLCYNACIVATQVKETIKIVSSDGFIVKTPNRNTLWTAQTPQAFEYTSIKQAYELFHQDEDKLNKAITDDAMVYESYINRPVKIVPGDYYNIKLTTPEDLIVADGILKQLLYEQKKQFF